MRAFVDDRVLDSRETIEDHCSGSSLDVVDGLLEDGGAYSGRDGEFVDVLKCLCHLDGCRELMGRGMLIVVWCGTSVAFRRTFWIFTLVSGYCLRFGEKDRFDLHRPRPRQRHFHLQLNDHPTDLESFTMRPSQVMRSGGGGTPIGMYHK